MSVSRPVRCLFAAPSVPKKLPRSRRQNFHTSPNLNVRNRQPKFPNIKAVDMGLISHPKNPYDSTKLPAIENYPRYTKEEKRLLEKKYTPEQMEAIKAGESAIDPEDLDSHGVIRTDLGSLPYLDDFSEIRPMIDRAPQYDGPVDPDARFMTESEMKLHTMEAMEKYAERRMKYAAANLQPRRTPRPDDEIDRYTGKRFTESPTFGTYMPPAGVMTRMEMMALEEEAPYFMGSDGKPIPMSKTPDLFAPGLPTKFLEEAEDEGPPGATQRKKMEEEKTEAEKDDEADPRDPDGIYNRLIKETGITLDDIFDLHVKILVRHRVSNQTRLGKISSQYCLAIAGNGNGRLGLGQAKGQEVEETQNNAKISAILNMQPIPRYEDRTIYGEVDGKLSAVEVKIMSRPPGFGLRCQHLIYEMARAAGIHDLAARVPRSRNKMNTVKATYQALLNQRIPDEIARGRGKKLVDVRKVYYGGRV